MASELIAKALVAIKNDNKKKPRCRRPGKPVRM
jgi:hypothetical protein